MNDHEKSDECVVPRKHPNRECARAYSAEDVEGRRSTKGNSMEGNRSRTQSREILQNSLHRVREAAGRNKDQQLTSLWHHCYDVDHLRAIFLDLREDAAAGVDGATWTSYAESLEDNLRDLGARLARGAYQAMPVRRVYIPKPDGRERPLGIPTLEDKLVQGITRRVLDQIYEQEFLGFSYGFRPRRGAHQALDALAVALQRKKVNWVLDADIRGFFDAIDHECLITMIEHRVGDPRVLHHIKKWLNAGVLEDGTKTQAEYGTPQGGSISPLLANIYLHYAFDLWVKEWRRTDARGEVYVVRYADDFVLGFQYESDAQRLLEALKRRFKEYHLELHPEKTRLLEFGRFAAANRQRRGEGKPDTFNFLGFTHYCGKTKTGAFQVGRKTIQKRMLAKVKTLKERIRLRMHAPVAETGAWLERVITGHYRYFGVPGNIDAMQDFRDRVSRLWYTALRRRSQKSRFTWIRMHRLLVRWLPQPRIFHPWPGQRFDATYPR